MRSVGVREFRDQATTLMKLGETIRIERHGKPVGFFVPVPKPKHNRREIDESLDRVGEVVERVLAQTGLNEEDLVRALVPEDQQG
ncbi:type II toxin-antitoxin system Phd/YefM family antitoxin [Candidatus Poriferisocius sp.]|uniref:type II toxin-antitoxin system Phd/YefM family antitoxin n=1 Tax=Candidatus Poriferisocius sp. TaxID=3101276 RepID=UPI003B58D52F